MFKLVVLSALLTIAAAEPGQLYAGSRLGYHAAYATPAIAAVRAAFSRTYRTDIYHAPAFATYAAAAPLAHAAIAAPIARAAYAAPLAYAAPALSHGYAKLGYAAAPLAYARYG